MNKWHRGRKAAALLVAILLAPLVFPAGCGPRPPAHGVEFLVEIHRGQISDEDYRRTVDSLRRRAETFSRSAAFSEPAGSNRVRIRASFPTEADLASTRILLTNSALLEFRIVQSASGDLVKQDTVPPDCEKLMQKQPKPGMVGLVETFIVKKEPAGGLTSREIRSAMVGRDNLGRMEIRFQFAPEGTRILAEITRANLGRRIAMVLNGEVLSAPTVVDPIEQGSATLSGNFERRETFEIASLLAHPLVAPVTLLEERPF